MLTGMRLFAKSVLLVLLLAVLSLPTAAQAGRYRAENVCGHPAPGRAGCLSSVLVPKSLGPSNLRSRARRQHRILRGHKIQRMILETQTSPEVDFASPV